MSVFMISSSQSNSTTVIVTLSPLPKLMIEISLTVAVHSVVSPSWTKSIEPKPYMLAVKKKDQ